MLTFWTVQGSYRIRRNDPKICEAHCGEKPVMAVSRLLVSLRGRRKQHVIVVKRRVYCERCGHVVFCMG